MWTKYNFCVQFLEHYDHTHKCPLDFVFMLDHSRLLSVLSIFYDLYDLFFNSSMFVLETLWTLMREIQGEKALKKENSVLYSLQLCLKESTCI